MKIDTGTIRKRRIANRMVRQIPFHDAQLQVLKREQAMYGGRNLYLRLIARAAIKLNLDRAFDHLHLR